MDKVTYDTTDAGYAVITVNGEKVRCRSFKMEHEVGGVPLITLELVNPKASINAVCNLLSGDFYGKSKTN